MKKEILSAQKTAEMIKNDFNVATNGFVGSTFPEELAIEIEKRSLCTGKPRCLALGYKARQGDTKLKGIKLFWVGGAYQAGYRRAIGDDIKEKIP